MAPFPTATRAAAAARGWTRPAFALPGALARPTAAGFPRPRLYQREIGLIVTAGDFGPPGVPLPEHRVACLGRRSDAGPRLRVGRRVELTQERRRAVQPGNRVDDVPVRVKHVVDAVPRDGPLDRPPVPEIDRDLRRRPLRLPVEHEPLAQRLRHVARSRKAPSGRTDCSRSSGPRRAARATATTGSASPTPARPPRPPRGPCTSRAPTRTHPAARRPRRSQPAGAANGPAPRPALPTRPRAPRGGPRSRRRARPSAPPAPPGPPRAAAPTLNRLPPRRDHPRPARVREATPVASSPARARPATSRHTTPPTPITADAGFRNRMRVSVRATFRKDDTRVAPPESQATPESASRIAATGPSASAPPPQYASRTR